MLYLLYLWCSASPHPLLAVGRSHHLLPAADILSPSPCRVLCLASFDHCCASNCSLLANTLRRQRIFSYTCIRFTQNLAEGVNSYIKKSPCAPCYSTSSRRTSNAVVSVPGVVACSISRPPRSYTGAESLLELIITEARHIPGTRQSPLNLALTSSFHRTKQRANVSALDHTQQATTSPLPTMFLPATLLALLAVTVLASPIDLPSRRQHDTREVGFALPSPPLPTSITILTSPLSQCDAATISQIFDTLSYDPLSATAFCTQVLSANIDLKAFAPRLPKNRSPGDITAACQCIVTTSVPAPPPAQAPVAQQPNRIAEAEELKLREAVPQAAALRYDPYGKGAEPVPLGSELKGFGGKVPYVRSGRVEGTRW